MAQPIDSSARINFKFPASESDPSTPSAGGAPPVECPTPERCLQALDPSFASAVSHIGDCTLDCSYCAYRWTARRTLLDDE